MTAGVNARLPAIAVKLNGVMDAMKPSRGLRIGREEIYADL